MLRSAGVPAGLASIDPAFNVFNVPMFFNSYPELYATLDKLEPTLKQRLEAKGFVPVTAYSSAGDKSDVDDTE